MDIEQSWDLDDCPLSVSDSDYRSFMRLQKILPKEENDFVVVNDLAAASFDVNRPALVFVHPGDAIEVSHGLSRIARDRLFEESVSQQQAAGAEIIKMLNDPLDVIVLHRDSSCALFESADRNYDEYYREAVIRTSVNGVLYFGDRLEEAVEAIGRTLSIQHRPRVLVTGAYGNPKDGCAAFVARALHRANANTQISRYTYLQPGRNVRRLSL